MNPIRRKLRSFLIETAHNGINAVDPESMCAKELSKIKDIDAAVVETVEKICQAATSAEITKVLLLVARLRGTSGQKRESITNDIKKISEVLIARVEAESGPLKLPQSCRIILLGV